MANRYRDDSSSAVIETNLVTFSDEIFSRPECVITTAAGDVFASDNRGGIAHLRGDGTFRLILAKNSPVGFLPNGIALLPDRSFLIADAGANGVWHMDGAGNLSPFLMEVEGRKIPAANFVHRDSVGRVWITISSWRSDRSESARKGLAEGALVLVEGGRARVVADGLAFANEARVHPLGDAIYVNETIGRRVSRFSISADNSVGPRETVSEFGIGGFVDGLNFDRDGNIWVVCCVSNQIVKVDYRTGRQQVIISDADYEHLASVEEKFQAEQFAGWSPGRDRHLSNPSSINFGGLDLRTGLIGFSEGKKIGLFQSPIAGSEPAHWRF